MSTPENLMRILFEHFYRCNKHFVINTNNFGCLSDGTLINVLRKIVSTPR